MDRFCSKKTTGFSLAEVVVTLCLIGVLSAITISGFRGVVNPYSKIYHSSFYIAESVINDIPTMDSGFCNNFLSRVNTIGTANCTSSSVSLDKPNFITSNGVKWYGLEGDFSTNPKIITVDVNGSNIPNADNQDRLKMRVYSAGYVLPDSDPVEVGYAYVNPTSCSTIQTSNPNIAHESGMYTINFNGSLYDVFCDMTSDQCSENCTPAGSCTTDCNGHGVNPGAWTIYPPTVDLSSIIKKSNEVIMYFNNTSTSTVSYALLQQSSSFAYNSSTLKVTFDTNGLKMNGSSYLAGTGSITTNNSLSWPGTSTCADTLAANSIPANQPIPASYFYRFSAAFSGCNATANGYTGIIGVR